MFYSSVCTLMLIIPAVISQLTRDPCSQLSCFNGQECRLVQPNFCFRQPCTPEPKCIQKLNDLRTCRFGAPVLDIYNQLLTCYPGRDCPPTTTCNTEVMDVQATCCWTPQGGQPPYPPPYQPPYPPQPQTNPCANVYCRLGQECQVRPSANCFLPPCPSAGVCVDQKPPGVGPINPFAPQPPFGPVPLPFGPAPPPFGPPPFGPAPPPYGPFPPSPPTPQPRGPCQTAKCSPGYECKEVPSKCNNPTCPLTAMCIKKPTAPVAPIAPTAPPAPGSQCPVFKGPLNCDVNCEIDADCEMGEICCKHKCGSMCSKPFNGTAAASQAHPCDTVKCSAGSECRLRQVNCFRSPCPATASCGPVIPKGTIPKCPTGLPATDTTNKELFCGRGFASQPCPDGTFCNTDPLDRFAACCHKEGPTVSPPATNPCAAKSCPFGSDCRVETIVCVRPPCPGDTAVCRPTNKQGSCPTVPPGFGVCVADCTNDADCQGDHKCCGSCPRQCTAPALNLSLPPKPMLPTNPCATMFCRQGTTCQVKTNPCFNPPCPQRGECVPNVKPTPTPTKPVTKPGICKRPTGFGFCSTMCSGDEACPGTLKCCSNGCGYECQEPLTDKTGFCPTNAAQGNSTTCQTQCNGDYTCLWDQKCCTQGCSSSCVQPLVSAPYVDSDPCKRQVCNANQVCKLQQMYCVSPPCQIQPVCFAKTPMEYSSVCASGYPVVGIRQVPFTCSSTNQGCPANSVCTNGSCCWDSSKPPTPTPTLKPQCPGVHDSSLWFFCNFYPTCTSHAGCPAGQSCCHASGCGKRCMTLKSK